MDEIILALLVSILFNLILFFPAFFFKTDKLTDISYALTFVIIASLLFYRTNMDFSRIIVLFMILLWAIRLGTYLFIRINKMKKDNRFDEFRHKFLSFLGFWMLQGVTVFLVILPTTLYFRSDKSTIWYFGIFVWLTGLIIESVADYQKFIFISKKKNAGKWIDSGLWHYSRHPNYFGEILCWIGIWIAIIPALSLSSLFISIIGPLFISLMLLYVSGIPLLEKKAKEKWGRNPKYIEYVKRTSKLVLWPKK